MSPASLTLSLLSLLLYYLNSSFFFSSLVSHLSLTSLRSLLLLLSNLLPCVWPDFHSEKAVILFAQSEVPRLIWRYMDASLYPENLVLSLLQFVNTVTDDCPPTCSFIRNQTDGNNLADRHPHTHTHTHTHTLSLSRLYPFVLSSFTELWCSCLCSAEISLTREGPKRLLTIQSNTEVSFLCRATATAVIFNIRYFCSTPLLFFLF